MQATFTLRKDELTGDFWKKLKSLFRGEVLSITVEDNPGGAPEPAMDETEYLLSSPANKQFLLEGIKEIEKGNVKKIEVSSL